MFRAMKSLRMHRLKLHKKRTLHPKKVVIITVILHHEDLLVGNRWIYLLIRRRPKMSEVSEVVSCRTVLTASCSIMSSKLNNATTDSILGIGRRMRQILTGTQIWTNDDEPLKWHTNRCSRTTLIWTIESVTIVMGLPCWKTLESIIQAWGPINHEWM